MILALFVTGIHSRVVEWRPGCIGVAGERRTGSGVVRLLFTDVIGSRVFFPVIS